LPINKEFTYQVWLNSEDANHLGEANIGKKIAQNGTFFSPTALLTRILDVKQFFHL